jgi:thiosulfate/3-mercaptopyruvate sulfurtransferase
MVTRTAALAGVVLLLAFAGVAPETAAHRELLCPACERFWADEAALDARGNCFECGRPPVAVEVALRRWIWCGSESAWREEACPADARRACCTEHGVTALVVDPSRVPVSLEPFCPACARFAASGRETCRRCGRETVEAPLARPSWFWCRVDGRWSGSPCGRPLATACDELVVPDLPAVVPLPAVHPISHVNHADPELLVSTDWLAVHLDDPNLVVVHVGAPAGAAGRGTFEEGHVPFARPLDWTEIAVSRDGLPNEYPTAERLTESIRLLDIDYGDRVVLYDTGSGMEAARAFVAFEYVGLRPALLDGMWAKWIREGRDVSRAYTPVESSGFLPLLRPDVVIPRRLVQDYAWVSLERGGGAVLLDARPYENFVGLTPGEGIKRPGHIPGAMNIPWMSVFRSPENPVFRSELELRALFESKGARPGVRVIIYCRTGTEAGPVYVAARLLGLEPSLYDGSFIEWSATPGLPVASRFASHVESTR